MTARPDPLLKGVFICLLLGIAIGWLGWSRLRQRLDLERQEKEQALAELETTRAELVRAQERLPSADELERRKREQSELLRLRGEVARLRNESKSPAQPKPAPAKDSAEAPLAETASPVTSFQANSHAMLAPRQTLVTGGWTAPSGKRLFLFVQPQIPEQTGQVLLTTRIVEVPEDLLAKLGMAGFISNGQESSINGILNARQSEDLYQNLQDTPGVDVLSAPRVMTEFGRQAQVAMTQEKTVSGVSYKLGPVIDLVAQRASDSALIDLSVAARLNQLTKPPGAP